MEHGPIVADVSRSFIRAAERRTVRNQFLVCALLISSLLLNACASALPLSVGARAVSGRIASRCWTYRYCRYPGSPMNAAMWKHRGSCLKQRYGRSCSSTRPRIRSRCPLLSRAQIPGQMTSAVAVELGNAGPYLTDIFAAHGHALADAGYETVVDPTLALSSKEYAESATQSYRMPGTPHGVTEDLRVLQYVVATSEPDTYVLYSLTTPESRFAMEAATFRRWAMAFHGNQPWMGSTVTGLDFIPDIGQEKVGGPPPETSEPDSGTGQMATLDQVAPLLDKAPVPVCVFPVRG